MTARTIVFLARISAALAGVMVVVLSLYGALAIHYWISWPDRVRETGAWAFPVVVLCLWFVPGKWLWPRRGVALALVGALFAAYVAKEPIERDWIDLQSKQASVIIDGDQVTIVNFRDAIHRPGEPSEVRWTTESFDLSQLEGADLIIQPFGGVKALAHVMLSFGFSDGRHVAVSIEARRVKGGRFDALAGLFRHDQIYPEIGAERDLFWQRLARTPPDELQIYPILRGRDAVRAYFERILAFVNEVHERPRFYSTLRESCMTTLMNLAPGNFMPVPWYDIRRWVPGYSLSLFQQLGLVDGTVPAQDLRAMRRLRDDVSPPWQFPSDAAWSAYLRSGF
ncbi:MAG: DUF4105 domain-containing protein [Pseudochelatococcus sp.]|jgi:hypothetical protein|uniref:lipoprotein N-acyltransferase Lnb domain-containing protein n=1 Tax=Pseudochelatococcus sp. TaxID=2020869 RepID=UPI003D8DF40C